MTLTSETESLDVLFAQICRLKHTRVQRLLEALGLYEGQPALLRSLWSEEGLTHTELARRLHVRPATVTKMIRRMEKSGFVERRPDPADQRLSRVYRPKPVARSKLLCERFGGHWSERRFPASPTTNGRSCSAFSGRSARTCA